PATAGPGSRRAMAGAGLAATAAAVGAAELLGGVVGPAPSLVLSIGDAVIDHVPGWLERLATSTLGHADKPVLVGVVLVVVALLGAGVGLLARGSFPPAAAGIVLAGALAGAAAAADPLTSTGWALGSALVAVVVGGTVLRWL